MELLLPVGIHNGLLLCDKQSHQVRLCKYHGEGYNSLNLLLLKKRGIRLYRSGIYGLGMATDHTLIYTHT